MTCSKGVSKESLDLIIHLPGGDYEATKRIIAYLHETYGHIRAFVPHLAMSGGTLLACAADEIFMGPYSSLGPTDPQIFLEGKYVPVGAVIEEFERAFSEVSQQPRRAILWRERLRAIPPGLVESLRVMRKNSTEYLKELLEKRNCKNINKNQLEESAKILNSYEQHSSHGRGISLKQAKEKLKLNVKNLRNGQYEELEDKVLSVYHTATILFQQTPVYKIIANHSQRRYLHQYQAPSPAK